jgi:thiamine-phosphate pyrophosphorylase
MMSNERMRHRLERGGIYLLTPARFDARWINDLLVPVLQESPGILQLRLKPGDTAVDALALASRLRTLAHGADTMFIVNDDVDLALACGADGVHLGREDVPVVEARQRLGAAAVIGASCYGDLDHALQQARTGADYLAFGSVFPSPTKPGAPVVGTAILAEARQRLDMPLVAIGGIRAEVAAECLSAGADWLAVVDAVWGSRDPPGALRLLQEAIANCPRRHRPDPPS